MTLTASTSQPLLRRSFRIVCDERTIPRVEALLHAEGFHFEPEPFCSFARRLSVEPFPLGRSLAAFFGYIYIQDRSSMLPPLALQVPVGAAVLDMCASPGSKTGLLAQLVGKEGFVLGNEPTKTRLGTLRTNLFTLNLLQTATCSWSGETMPYDDANTVAGENVTGTKTGIWDYILLDPPCSGWGTTNKHPTIAQIWTPEKAQNLVRLQQNLLRHAYTLLRPGGVLVYSTCTTHMAENEAQVRFACDILGFICEPIEPFAGFTFSDDADTLAGTLRVDEDASQAQGFFIARLRKPFQNSPLNKTLGESAAETSNNSANGQEANRLQHHVIQPHYEPLDKEVLRSFGLDPQKLPPGELGVFGSSVHFLHKQALERLPLILRWQGPIIAKAGNHAIIPLPRLRCLLDTANTIPSLDMDSLAPIHALLQGQSLSTEYAGKEAALLWQGLALGRVRLKNGRVLWTEK